MLRSDGQDVEGVKAGVTLVALSQAVDTLRTEMSRHSAVSGGGVSEELVVTFVKGPSSWSSTQFFQSYQACSLRTIPHVIHNQWQRQKSRDIDEPQTHPRKIPSNPFKFP
eukprot:4216808-Amphidinium_carterae.1